MNMEKQDNLQMSYNKAKNHVSSGFYKEFIS